MRQNLLDEINHPLDERRNIDVVNPNFFFPATKHLKVITRTKRYGLVTTNASLTRTLSFHFRTDSPMTLNCTVKLIHAMTVNIFPIFTSGFLIWE